MIDLKTVEYPVRYPIEFMGFPELLKDWSPAQFHLWEEIGIISGFPEMAYKFNMSPEYLEIAHEITSRGLDHSSDAARSRWLKYCKYFSKWGQKCPTKVLYESILPFYVEDTLYNPEVWLYQKPILVFPEEEKFKQLRRVQEIVENREVYTGTPLITQHEVLSLGYAFGEVGRLDVAETIFLLMIKLLERWSKDSDYKRIIWDVDLNRKEQILQEWADQDKRKMSLYDLSRFLLSSYLGLTKIYKKQKLYNKVEETVKWAQDLWHPKPLKEESLQNNVQNALVHWGIGRNRIMELTAELIECYREMRCFEAMDHQINLLYWYTKTIYQDRRLEFEYATRHAEFASEPALIALLILDRVYK